MASAATETAAQVSALSNEDLTPIVDEAIERWIEVLGGENDLLETLYDVEFQIVDFDGLILGQATPEVISIDADAAGYGWFVDDTPFDDVEFADSDGDGELTTISGSEAVHRVRIAASNVPDVESNPVGTRITTISGSEAEGRMDLLTAVMHELGHVLGYEDVDPAAADLMSETLDTGVRQLLGNNGTGQSQESTTNLVAMDLTPDASTAEDTLDSLVNDNPWLVKYLLNGAEDDTNPNDDIAVVIPKEDPQDSSTEGSSDPVGDPNAKGKGNSK